MTKAMPFLQKAILLSYDPRRIWRGDFFLAAPGSRSSSPAKHPPPFHTVPPGNAAAAIDFVLRIM